jgi:hypothetical protein
MPETSRLLGSDHPPRRWPDGTVGMQPIRAGRIVLRAIELDLGHIFTHPQMWPAVRHRADAIIAAARVAEEEWPSIPG